MFGFDALLVIIVTVIMSCGISAIYGEGVGAIIGGAVFIGLMILDRVLAKKECNCQATEEDEDEA